MKRICMVVLTMLLVAGLCSCGEVKCALCKENPATEQCGEDMLCTSCYEEISERAEKQREIEQQEAAAAKKEAEAMARRCVYPGCTEDKVYGYDYCQQHLNEKKDQLIAESNGKQLWKVIARTSTISFNGTFIGNGYFGITVDDYNQDFYELVANEIGSYIVNKSINVTPGNCYYIEISTTDGTWSISWTGTYGQ